MWRSISEAATRLAIRRLFAAYLLVSAPALLFPHHGPAWPALLALHLLGAAWLLQLGPFRALAHGITAQLPRATRIIGDWYALLLVPALYTELAPLNFAIFNGRYFDDHILAMEQAVFGAQPSRDLAAALPWLPLSEFLHLSYISYYLIIYGPPLYLYLRGRRGDQQKAVFTLMLAFFAHYVFFIYFPVQGPRYLFAAPTGGIERGYFYNLAHAILESGSARGAAFPSSHVGVSFAQTALAFLLLPRAAPLLLLVSSGLALGAVYGGFHYATDAICGLLYGLLLFALAPRVVRWLSRPRTQ